MLWLLLNKTSHSLITTAFLHKAAIDNTSLKNYLQKKKQIATTLPVVTAVKKTVIKISAPAFKISNENLTALEKFIQQLYLKAYSPSTIKTYRNEFMQLLQLLPSIPMVLLPKRFSSLKKGTYSLNMFCKAIACTLRKSVPIAIGI